MKKITICFMALFLMVSVNNVTINAVLKVTYGMKASVPSIGKSGSITITTKGITGRATHDFQVEITSGGGVIQLLGRTHFVETNNGTVTVNFNALKEGTARVSITSGKGFDMEAGEKGEYFESTGFVDIQIKPNVPVENPNPPPTPTPTPKPPVKDDTESEKDRIAREQEQKRIDEENKVKAEEERIIKEKEALAKVPLFNEISITSQSDKLKNEVIKSITIEEGVVEYEYSLPRKVNKVSIAIPETEGVTLTYDKEVSFGEDEESKVVSIKAVKEDIEQSYTIKINQDITPDVSKEVNGKNLIVHQDERVSEYFKTLGFETVFPEDATVGNVFENENVKFQLLVNENNEGKYYQLDEAYSIQGEVQLSLSAEEEVFFVKNLEDSDEKKLQNKKISKIAHDSAITLSDVDPLLKISNEILGWEIDEGIVFNGVSSNGQSDQFILSSDNSISKVVVVFDKPGNNQNLTIIILSVVLVAVLSTQAVYFISGYIRKKKY